MEEKIKQFLNSNDYDIRKNNNARWIDQKCTMDVLSVVADCIIEFVGDEIEKEFTTNDIWYNEYTVENVQSIFNKPNPADEARNEYDKWFGQPLKLLGNAKVLIEEKRGNRNYYKVNNMEILKYIASRDRFAHKFLVLYITKVLQDSDIYSYFDNFFQQQNRESYQKLKVKYHSFIQENTRINGDLECGRIFAKVLNPLAFELKKRGTERGSISSNIITLDMLMYNRPNWRDIYNKKPKEMTRIDFERMYEISKDDKMSAYKINKAKRQLKQYNIKYNDGISEILNGVENGEKATHMHHIFMASEFPLIASYVENLIALTPTQHLNHAHINGNTNSINYDFQRLCLIAKVGKIKECLEDEEKEKIYSFEDLCYVLNVGFSTDKFEYVAVFDFTTILEYIDFMYVTAGGESDWLVAEERKDEYHV